MNDPQSHRRVDDRNSAFFAEGFSQGQDPSSNVLNLVASAIHRQDDLRNAEAHAVREMANLREGHIKDLREAEAKRIDAIRAVDVGAVNRAAEVAAAQAMTLANQVTVSAETLRTQVAATASAGETALRAALEPIVKDIADLRRVQYEAQGGKAQTVESRDVGASRNSSVGVLIGGVFGATGFLIGLAGIILSR